MKSAKKSTWRRSRFYESRKHQSDSHCKSGWNDRPIRVRPASADDFIADLMVRVLTPFYDSDLRAHARRIFDTHIAGRVCGLW